MIVATLKNVLKNSLRIDFLCDCNFIQLSDKIKIFLQNKCKYKINTLIFHFLVYFLFVQLY